MRTFTVLLFIEQSYWTTVAAESKEEAVSKALLGQDKNGNGEYWTEYRRDRIRTEVQEPQQ